MTEETDETDADRSWREWEIGRLLELGVSLPEPPKPATQPGSPDEPQAKP